MVLMASGSRLVYVGLFPGNVGKSIHTQITFVTSVMEGEIIVSQTGDPSLSSYACNCAVVRYIGQGTVVRCTYQRFPYRGTHDIYL